MKLFLRPSQHSAHRIACKALYRALLEQCPRVQHLAEGWPSTPLTFKHLIRKQFKRNQNVESPRLVVAALKAGYEAEEMLRHAGDGNETAREKIMAVLLEIETNRALSRANANLSPKKEVIKRPLPAPYPGTKPIIKTRPRPKEELGGSGIRKVPKFINANTYPMLRFSKQHSPFLSRVIRQKIVRQRTLHERMYAQEEMIKMGRDEDSWDTLIESQRRREVGSNMGSGDDVSWTHGMKEQIKLDQEAMHEQGRKNKAMARNMLEIVRKEESLAARERMERKRERKKEKLGLQGDGKSS